MKCFIRGFLHVVALSIEGECHCGDSTVERPAYHLRDQRQRRTCIGECERVAERRLATAIAKVLVGARSHARLICT